MVLGRQTRNGQKQVAHYMNERSAILVTNLIPKDDPLTENLWAPPLVAAVGLGAEAGADPDGTPDSAGQPAWGTGQERGSRAVFPNPTHLTEKPRTDRSDYQSRARVGFHVDVQATFRSCGLRAIVGDCIGDRA